MQYAHVKTFQLLFIVINVIIDQSSLLIDHGYLFLAMDVYLYVIILYY